VGHSVFSSVSKFRYLFEKKLPAARRDKQTGRCLIETHDTPITGKTKVTDLTENTQSRILIFKGKPSLFQYVYLLGEGDRLFGIFHIQKKRPALVRWSSGSVAGSVGANVRLLFGMANLFE
jgi:hypothetical protein